MRKAYIYTITLPHDDKKFYVGSTVALSAREKQHTTGLKKGSHHSKKLQRSYKKYKCKTINFKVIEECSQEIRNEREQFWIDHYNSVDDGYNMMPVDIESAITPEMKISKRIDKIERYQELEDKLLDTFKAYEGVKATAYCDMGEFWSYSRFSLYGANCKRTDNQMITVCIENLEAFQRMLDEWIKSKSPNVRMYFQKDSSSTKSARNNCGDFYNMPSMRDYLIVEKDEPKSFMDVTREVNCVIAKCLGEYNSDSIYSRLMENITAQGFDMIKQIPITRRTCQEGIYPFTLDYLTNRELKKLDLIRKEKE